MAALIHVQLAECPIRVEQGFEVGHAGILEAVVVDAAMRRIGRWTPIGAQEPAGFIQWLVICGDPLDRPEQLPEKGRSGAKPCRDEYRRARDRPLRLGFGQIVPRWRLVQHRGLQVRRHAPPEPVAIRPPEFLTDEVRVERLANEPVDRTAQDSQAPPTRPDQARSLRASLVKFVSFTTPLDAANRSTQR